VKIIIGYWENSVVKTGKIFIGQNAYFEAATFIVSLIKCGHDRNMDYEIQD